MDEATLIGEIRQYIQTHILASEVTLEDDTELQQAGVDSFSIVEIILFIERQYGVGIPDDKLVPENFRTLQALAATVQELTSKAAL